MRHLTTFKTITAILQLIGLLTIKTVKQRDSIQTLSRHRGVQDIRKSLGKRVKLALFTVYLIGKTIKHLKLCRPKGVLFVPVWKSSYLWPLLTRDCINFESSFKHLLVLDQFYVNYASPQVSKVHSEVLKSMITYVLARSLWRGFTVRH